MTSTIGGLPGEEAAGHKASTKAVVVTGDERKTVRKRLLAAFGELWGDKLALLGATFLLIVLISAIFASLVAPHDPTALSLPDRLTPPAWTDGGNWSNVFGTDSLGRDVLSRMIYGSRTTLQIGFFVVLFAGTFGVTMGLIAGYFGGRVDATVMRFIDTQFAFPGLLLAITIISVIGASKRGLIIVLSIGAWMIFARVSRASALSIKESAYIEAAETLGCKPSRVIIRHILPNMVSPLLTLAVLEFAIIVLAEASLSFLGLGIQPPGMSLGLDVANGRQYILTSWWLVTIPGIAVSLIVLSSNLIAGWLRVVADPQERDKRFATTQVGSL
jgi:peptide/nickel transport system permease protein